MSTATLAVDNAPEGPGLSRTVTNVMDRTRRGIGALGAPLNAALELGGTTVAIGMETGFTALRQALKVVGGSLRGIFGHH